MDGQEFIDQLNSFRGSKLDEIKAIAHSRHGPVESRLAAILLELTLADHPLAHWALELVVELMDPETEREQIDPMSTWLAERIKTLIDKDQQELEACPQLDMAATVILMADSDDPEPDPYLDQKLRFLTARDLAWWLEWVHQHRS